MIKYIFWDNDECLSHSMFRDPEQEHHKLIFDDEPKTISVETHPDQLNSFTVFCGGKLG